MTSTFPGRGEGGGPGACLVPDGLYFLPEDSPARLDPSSCHVLGFWEIRLCKFSTLLLMVEVLENKPLLFGDTWRASWKRWPLRSGAVFLASWGSHFHFLLRETETARALTLEYVGVAGCEVYSVTFCLCDIGQMHKFSEPCVLPLMKTHDCTYFTRL